MRQLYWVCALLACSTAAMAKDPDAEFQQQFKVPPAAAGITGDQVTVYKLDCGYDWQGPTNAPWITAKIVGLLAYIALGMVALRFGRTKGVRAAAWVLALLTFGYIVSVAITKDPRGFMLWT